jgi:RNA polymerase sigma-70 factor (ECF subfamily)
VNVKARKSLEKGETVTITEDNCTQFENIFDHLFDRVFSYVFSRTNNRQVAEDLTSEIFLKILEALPRYHDRQSMAAWVFTIARNTLISHYRFSLRHPILSIEASGLGEFKPVLALGKNTKDVDRYLDLERALNRLPGKERELLRLKYAAGLSFEEIGELLRKRPEAIKMAIHRLLRRLEDEMEHSE